MNMSRRAMLPLIGGGLAFAIAGRPVLAARSRRFRVTDFGAKGDGRTLNTAAIQRAVDACAVAGGGAIVIPRGIFLSGSIFLKPGVGLQIERDGVLRGSGDYADYPLTLRRFVESQPEALRWALVNASGNHGLRIAGPGVIEGGGEAFWKRAFSNVPEESVGSVRVQYHSPQLCFVQDSNDVTVSKLVFRNSGFWNLHLYRCRRVVVEDCRFEVSHRILAPSSDGTDVDSCQDVTIRRCFYSVDDDCIALKGTQGADAAAYAAAPPVERIHIHDCVFEKGLGGVTWGSNATIVRDVLIERCELRGDMPMIRFKIRPDTPGQLYEHIRVRGIRLYPAAPGPWHGGEPVHGRNGPEVLPGDEPKTGLIVNARLTHGTRVPARAPGGIIRDVVIEDVRGTTRGFGSISGNATTSISDFTLRNFDVTLTDPARTKLVAKGVTGLRIENVRVNGAPVEVVS
jgi:alpha-L-rhamnosidase